MVWLLFAGADSAPCCMLLLQYSTMPWADIVQGSEEGLLLQDSALWAASSGRLLWFATVQSTDMIACHFRAKWNRLPHCVQSKATHWLSNYICIYHLKHKRKLVFSSSIFTLCAPNSVTHLLWRAQQFPSSPIDKMMRFVSIHEPILPLSLLGSCRFSGSSSGQFCKNTDLNCVINPLPMWKALESLCNFFL